MANQFRFHPKANSEFRDSVKWHKQNREDSGKEFANDTFSKIDEILKKPESRSQDEDGIRWIGLSKFPYHIFYIFKAPVVWILAIWHTSRKKDKWRDRKIDIE